jgi:ERCC4-type nuclease
MILVDSRVGSKHYADLLGDKAMLTQLESADIAFQGNGVIVGIEVKKVLDAVNCLYSGRLTDHQIPLMKSQYDVVYLIVEGLWRPDPESGIMQYYVGELGKWGSWKDVTSGQKRLLYSAFESWLSTITMQSGTLVKNTPSMQITVHFIMAAYHWWQKSLHRSFHTMDETTPEAVLSRPTMLRRMMALLPRIGWSRSAILASKFNNMEEVLNAKPEDFVMEGIAIGTAIKIWEALHGQERI